MTEKWMLRFYELAKHVSAWSKDPSTRVGAVLVWFPLNSAPVVAGLGFNGLPRGVSDDVGRYEDRTTKYAMIVHAELNALLTSTREVRGCALVSTLFPCQECVKAIIQAGVAEVYAPQPTGEVAERWAASFKISMTMLTEARVNVITFPIKEETCPT